VVRAGAGCWDRGRTPIHPLTLEYAYADPQLLRDLGTRGARSAQRFGVDVVVGAETGGVPLAAAVSLAGGVPFAFVRKPGYRGHEVDEPPVRGAEVRDRRVLLVDDARAFGEPDGLHIRPTHLADPRDLAEATTRNRAGVPARFRGSRDEVRTIRR
jgi:orotate phosphoribosyltransferase